MTELSLNENVTNHTAGDGLAMKLTMRGCSTTATMISTSDPLVQGGLPSSLELGFVPVGDRFTLAEPTVRPSDPEQAEELQMDVDAPKGYHLVAMVEDPNGGEPQWFFPQYAPPSLTSGSRKYKKRKSIFRIVMRVAKAARGLFGRTIQFLKVRVDAALRKIELKPKKLRQWIAKNIDRLLLKQGEGLKHVRPDMGLPVVNEAERTTMEGKKLLLFVHGIFSSIGEAFGEAGPAEPHSPSPIAALVKKYEGRVIGFDHYTVSKTTLQNATDLLEALPRNITLNIVCHSRGAGVVRCMLEHPALKQERIDKNFHVESVVFVAGACVGSPLAQGSSVNRLMSGLNRLLGLAGVSSIPAKVALAVVKLVLHGVQKLPGIHAMSPDAAVFKKLKEAQRTKAKRYVYFRANFDPKNVPLNILDEIIIDQKIFRGKGNDVIVPFAGAGVSGEYLNYGQVIKVDAGDYGTETEPATHVWHTNFFAQSGLRAALLDYV